MTSAARVRKLALALPEVTEADHHGRPSFRVNGRILATLWDADRLNVMLDTPGILAAAAENPGVCEAFWWGRRVRAVQVTLAAASAELLEDLLEDAWARKAPRRLLTTRRGRPARS